MSYNFAHVGRIYNACTLKYYRISQYASFSLRKYTYLLLHFWHKRIILETDKIEGEPLILTFTFGFKPILVLSLIFYSLFF